MSGGLDAWVGRERVETDRLDPWPARGLAALLDRDGRGLDVGSPLPEAWHWLYFRPLDPQRSLGEDGHPVRGGFLPPVPLPRRMWAGGRLSFPERLVLGEEAERRSRVAAVTEKRGRSGPLVFVTVEHTVTGPRGVAVEEEQDLVFRERMGRQGVAGASGAGGPATRAAGGPPEGAAPPEEPDWTDEFVPTPVALFRFSALTFNPHRIHYDHPYATEVEGYPGLLVHAPLTALLMLEAARTRGAPGAAGPGPARVLGYRYRAASPLFAGGAITLAGRAAPGSRADAGERGGAGASVVWAAGPDGALAMEGRIEWG